MNHFEYDDYRLLLNDLIKKSPKAGHGVSSKISKFLNISSVLVSQILKGTREMSVEQAMELRDFFKWNDSESEYFVLLVQRSRAGTSKLKSHFSHQINNLRQKAKDVASISVSNFEFSEAQKVHFYANWYHSAIRLLASVADLQDPEKIATRLDLSAEEVTASIEFLLSCGLIIKKDNKFQLGPQRTHLPKNSPLFKSRQTSWRLQGIKHLDKNKDDNVFYTSPLSISKSQAHLFRQEIMDLIKKLGDRVASESPDETYCINIDWFKF